MLSSSSSFVLVLVLDQDEHKARRSLTVLPHAFAPSSAKGRAPARRSQAKAGGRTFFILIPPDVTILPVNSPIDDAAPEKQNAPDQEESSALQRHGTIHDGYVNMFKPRAMIGSRTWFQSR